MKRIIFSLLPLLLIACTKHSSSNKIVPCGVLMTQEDMNLFEELKQKFGKDVYKGNKGLVYDELNNTIRMGIPDSVEFEVFSHFANENIVGVIVCTPNYNWLRDKISCSFTNAKYSSIMPKTLIMLYYNYKNNDPSLELIFQFGLKLNREE